MPDITLITYGGSLVTPQHDALMADAELSGNGIFYGCEVSAPSANQLHITQGVGVIYGREFEIAEHNINVESPQSGSLSGQVLIRLALSAPAPISIEVETAQTLTPLEDNADINTNTAHVTEMQLATFTIDINGISNVNQTVSQIERLPEIISSLRSDTGWKSIGNYCVYRKVGKWVFLRYRLTGQESHNTGDALLTVPAAIKPAFLCIERNAYDAGGWCTLSPTTGVLEFSTNGNPVSYIGVEFNYPI